MNHYLEKGDLALDGRGERLPEILQAREARKRAEAEQPLREEMVRLAGDRDHFRWMISYGGATDTAMLDQLASTERRIGENRSQLGEGNGPH